MRLASREGSEDDSLPEPENLGFAPDEIDFIYDLWALWVATDKRYLPSQLVPELKSGYGRILTGMLEMESLYARVKKQLKKQTTDQNNG